jgi:NAD(P)-dependent dehydrogenase (short-subunit alcohol dehydrogenase family)
LKPQFEKINVSSQRITYATAQGHALLTKALLPILTKTAAEANSDVRIVNLCSEVHKFAPRPAGFLPDDCQTDMAAYSTWTRYGQSKLANILFTTELARRYPAITAVAIHPGGVATNLITPFIKDHPYLTMPIIPFWKVFAMGASQGAWNQTWAATAPVAGKEWTRLETKGGRKVEEVKSGAYYTPVTREGGQTDLARDSELAGRLWEWTEEQLKVRGY